MRRALLIAAVLASTVLVAPTAARAGFFPGDPIDTTEIAGLGDVDLARDGTGAVAYVRRDAGVEHIFVSRFTGGRFQPPERIDAGLPGPSSQPVVGASDGGRLLIAFVNGGAVHGVVKPGASAGYAAPVALAPGIDPAADLSINGTGYVTFTGGGDVRAARLDRRSNGWAVLPEVVDADPTREAGVGAGRSRVAISADGVGVVTWGEAGHVWARKMFNTGLSRAPQDLTPTEIGGRPATVSDLPDVDAEDDSSYAWVVFRQHFADGGTRVLARRQRGTGFDPPVAVDPGDEPAGEPRIDMNGRGVSVAVASGSIGNHPIVTPTRHDAFVAPARFAAPGVFSPRAVSAVAENNDALVAAIVSPPGGVPHVRARTYDEITPEAELTISRPELGPVAPELGFDAASDRGFGVVTVWIQGGPGDRKLVAGLVDRQPAAFTGNSSQRCCKTAQPTLSWQPAFDLWGGLRYQVLVDGVVRGETTQTRLTLPAALPGGTHRWQVVAIDQRGQQKRSRTRLLRIDDLAPRQSIRYRRSGRVVSLSVRGRDRKVRGQNASGIDRVTISWGDGSRSRARSRISTRHRYRRTGRYELVVTSRDRAGNETERKRTVRIGG